MFATFYDLLNTLTTFDQIDLAQLTLASPAAARQQALVQGIESHQQLEARMDGWANDLNHAVISEQEAQSEEQHEP